MEGGDTMGKVEKDPKYYFVTVTLRPEGFKKILLEGFFVPKKGQCSPAKIKAQVWAFLKPQIHFEKYGLDPLKLEKEIKVKAMPADFVMREEE